MTTPDLTKRVLDIAAQFCWVPVAHTISVNLRGAALTEEIRNSLGDLETAISQSGRRVTWEGWDEMCENDFIRFHITGTPRTRK